MAALTGMPSKPASDQRAACRACRRREARRRTVTRTWPPAVARLRGRVGLREVSRRGGRSLSLPLPTRIVPDPRRARTTACPTHIPPDIPPVDPHLARPTSRPTRMPSTPCKLPSAPCKLPSARHASRPRAAVPWGDLSSEGRLEGRVVVRGTSCAICREKARKWLFAAKRCEKG